MAVQIDSRVLDKRLERLANALSGGNILQVVATRQLAWINQNFRREGIENKWKPLAPGTVEARRKKSKKPLQDTGRMRQSFTKKVRQTVAVVGTVNRLAGIHHAGARIPAIVPVNKKALTIPDPGGPVRFKKGRLRGKRGFFTRRTGPHDIPARPLLPSKMLAESLAEKTILASIRKAARRTADG